MNCKKCGAPLNPADRFCQACGQPVDATTETLNQNQTQAEVVGNPNEALGAMPNNSAATLNNETVLGTNAGMVEQTQQVPNNTTPVVNPFEQPTQMNQNPFDTPNQMNNMNYNIPNATGNKNTNNIIMVIMGVVIVALIGVVLYLVLGSNSPKAVEKDKTKKEDTTPTQTEVKNTTTATLGKYTVQIPNEYEIDSDGEEMQIMTDTKYMYLTTIENASLQQINVNYVKANIENENLTVLETNTKSYGGVNMIVFGIDDSGNKEFIVYAEIANKGILGAEIANLEGTLDYSLLEDDLASIAKSAKYKSSTNSITTNKFAKNITKIKK